MEQANWTDGFQNKTEKRRWKQYPDEYISDLCDAADIIGIIGKHTDLFPSGGQWMGLCPFHDDKHPSFSVNSEKGLYHCFACHSSGNVITFLREKEGMTFREAIRHLETETGLRPPSPIETTAMAFKIDGEIQLDDTSRDLEAMLFEIADRCGLILKNAWRREIVYKRIMKIFEVVDDAYENEDAEIIIDVLKKLDEGLLKRERLMNVAEKE